MSIDVAVKDIERAEANAIFELCKRMGFGNVMSTASRLWQGLPDDQGGGKAAFAVGPPVLGCEPCLHLDSDNGGAGCAWCEGAGWLTHYVAKLQRKAAECKKQAEGASKKASKKASKNRRT